MGHAIPTRILGRAMPRRPRLLPESMLMDDEYWSHFSDPLPLSELATILRISEATVLRRLGDATIPAHFIGRSWIVFQSEFRAWLVSRRNQPFEELPNPDPLINCDHQLGMAELIELFGKTKQTIRRWLLENQIPGYMLNGRWTVYTRELREALNANSNTPHTS
jgi:predicted DNA-binding transcriptional regulator AlpA